MTSLLVTQWVQKYSLQHF